MVNQVPNELNANNSKLVDECVVSLTKISGLGSTSKKEMNRMLKEE
jgi:hypothetical protein